MGEAVDIVTDEELAWCAANPTVPEAAAVLATLGPDGDLQPDPSAAWLTPLALALRAVRPRRPILVRDVLVFLGPREGGGEALMFRKAPHGADVLVALDRQHARWMRVGLPAEWPFPVRMFALDRVLRDDELEGWRSRNEDGVINEFFAAVGNPGGDDEAFVGMLTRHGGVPMCFAESERMAALVPFVADARRAAGASVGIRRFVRSVPVAPGTLRPLSG